MPDRKEVMYSERKMSNLSEISTDVLSTSNLHSDGTGSPSARSSVSDVDVSHHDSDSDVEIDVETVDNDVTTEYREKTFWECYPNLLKFQQPSVMPMPVGCYAFPAIPMYFSTPTAPLFQIPMMTPPMTSPLNLSTVRQESPPESDSASSAIDMRTSTGSGNPRKLTFPDTPLRSGKQRGDPVKKYGCDYCGKSFSRSNTLVTHKRIHTGDKPFECDLCGRCFRQPGNLTRHRLTHTPVKPFPCPICRKAFNRASNLQTHMRTHSKIRPYGCVTCGEAFECKDELKQHTFIHGENKNLHCNICGQTFSQMSQLSQHMRQHTDLLLRHDVATPSPSMTS